MPRKGFFLMITLMALCVLIAMPAYAGKKLRLRVNISPKPPNLTAKVKFTEPSGNRALDAGEKGKLIVTVSNSGPGDAFGVMLSLKPEGNTSGLSYARTVKIGTTPAGKIIKTRLDLLSTGSLSDGQASLILSVSESGGFDADSVRIAFSTYKFEAPGLLVAEMTIDDQNGNSKVEAMENVEVRLRIQNMGQGTAHKVAVKVLPGKNVFLGGSRANYFKLGKLTPGQYKDVKFMFYTNKRIRAGQSIPLSVKLDEARDKYKVSSSLGLVMNSRQRRMSEVVVKGKKRTRLQVELSTGLVDEVDKGAPVTKMKNKNAIAVVIGNANYHNAKDVDYAINDARAIKEYLIKSLGYKEGNIFYHTNATKGDFENLFGVKGNHEGKLFHAVKKGKSDIFVYYSGHGAPGLKDGKGYFVPIEADPQYLNLGGYSADVFFENLSRIPSRELTVVLDACFSGANIFENISPMVVEIDYPMLAMNKGVVISSSTGSQVSSWYEEKQHSMFTYFFLKAIHNRNADIDKDGILKFSEVFDYISDKTEGVPYQARRIHGVEQDPVIQGKYKDKVLLKY